MLDSVWEKHQQLTTRLSLRCCHLVIDAKPDSEPCINNSSWH